ncbi:hypothetical protein MHH70_00905 [Metasolibacillus sp. FSL H7-0170]|uniref:hypothetical protein n=1 Tax=Metasolibacillus TaxID=2703677 RepID=UPI000D38E130|nr:hypothetical protein [Metasolibacillus fluoroglycofenilyticus]
MKIIVALMFSFLLLAGCQSEQVKQEKLEGQEEFTFYERNVKPRMLEVVAVEGSNGTAYTPLLSYCWNPDLTQCPSELNNEPPSQDVFENSPAMKIKPNEKLQLQIVKTPDDFNENVKEKLPFPTKIEAFKVISNQYEPVELKDDYLTMPAEEGRYIYLFRVTYDEEFKGIAYYAWQGKVEQ